MQTKTKTHSLPPGEVPSAGDPRFRQWEKLRRDRFNDLLQDLAQLLPGYDDPSAHENGVKWSKKEIVERAIQRLQGLDVSRPSSNPQPPQLPALARQNRKLRELIRLELGVQLKDVQFRKWTLAQIRAHIATQGRVKSKSSDLGNEENIDPTRVLRDEDVFVAPIHSSDHSYALMVQDQPDIEIQEEMVIGEEVEVSSAQDSPPSVSALQAVVSEVPPVLESAPIPAVIQAPPIIQVSSSMPQFTILPSPQFLVPSILGGNVFMRTVRPVDKLPLPRLDRSQSGVQTVSVISGVKSSVLDLSELRRMRIGRRGQKKRTKKQIAEDKEKERLAKEKPAEKNEAVIDIQDVTRVEASLPAAILASEDPNASDNEEEAPVETIDLTKDSEGKAKPVVEAVKEPTKQPPLETLPSRLIKKRLKRDVDNAEGKTKSKSSYSIAALCQISVNIGEPNEPGIANSPGMVSLNSVGTGSPAVTPAPTPTPPTTGIRSESLPNIAEVLNEPKAKLIEELRPNGEDPKGDLPPKDTEKALTSLHEELKRVDESLKGSKDIIVPSQVVRLSHGLPSKAVVPSAPKGESRKDLSIFDFPERRVDSPIRQFPRSPTKSIPTSGSPKKSHSIPKVVQISSSRSTPTYSSAASTLPSPIVPPIGQPTNLHGSNSGTTGQFHHHLPTHYPALPTIPNPNIHHEFYPYQATSTPRYHGNSQGTYHTPQNMHYGYDSQASTGTYYGRSYPTPAQPVQYRPPNNAQKKLRTDSRARPALGCNMPQLPTEPYNGCMGLMPAPDPQLQTKAFSVNQLVSGKQAQSKKPTKRPATSSVKTASVSKSRDAPPKETPRYSGEDNRYRVPKQPRQSSSSLSRSRTRLSYSAESLIANVNPPIDCNINHPGFDPMGLVNQGVGVQSQDLSRNWAGEPTNIGSFQFPSMSPSPAGNIFGSDIGTLDFQPSNIFGPSDPLVQTSMGSSNSPSKQYSYHKMHHSSDIPKVKSHHHHATSTASSVASSIGVHDCHHRGGSSIPSNVADQQYFNGTLFDNSLFPLQTLTPPTDDPMSYGPFVGHNSFYPNPQSSRSQTSTSFHPQAYSSQITTTSSSSIHKVRTHDHMGPPPLPTHPINPHLPPTTPLNQSSSLSNFNLSTIIPEINVNEKIPLAPMHKTGTAHSQTGSSSLSTSIVIGASNNHGLSVPPSSAGIPSVSVAPDFRQLTTPDILPHSIALLGSHSQMGISSMAHPFPGTSFASNVVPGLNFPLSDHQPSH